jgi:hypothetical protein
VLGPGETITFTYSSEAFGLGNKAIGREGEEIAVYLVVPGPKTGHGENALYSNKVPIKIY